MSHTKSKIDIIRKHAVELDKNDRCSKVYINPTYNSLVKAVRSGVLPSNKHVKEAICVLNRAVIRRIGGFLESGFEGNCASYGESLMNGFLEVMFAVTSSTNFKRATINDRPVFMTNPSSGKRLELDSVIGSYRMAYEFQGDFHYSSNAQRHRDYLKFEMCKSKGIVLVPVNTCQLSFRSIAELTLNSTKDFHGIHDLLVGKARKSVVANRVNGFGAVRTNICKMTSDICGVSEILKDSLDWLDKKSKSYQLAILTKYEDSTSAVYDAPTLAINPPLTIEDFKKLTPLLHMPDKQRFGA